MRRYDDPVDVRRGQVAGVGGPEGSPERVEGPEQFLWRGRLWKVSAVLAHWVETGPWWQSSGVHAVLGADDWTGDPAGDPASDPAGGTRTAVRPVAPDLCAERDVWRVEADRGMGAGRGVFDLLFDWADGSWRLARCLD
jgi:hypothetical protein